MSQVPSWSVGPARYIGKRIKALRGKRSAEWLAGRCTDLGHPISRSAIAKLENDGREDITLAELSTFAEALGVAPALLAFPVGTEEDVQFLPNKYADPWTAYRWFVGDLRPPSHLANVLEGADVLDAYQRHDHRLAGYLSFREGNPDAAAAYLTGLADAREDMRRHGWRLPSIPSDVAAAVAARESQGQRQFAVWDAQLETGQP